MHPTTPTIRKFSEVCRLSCMVNTPDGISAYQGWLPRLVNGYPHHGVYEKGVMLIGIFVEPFPSNYFDLVVTTLAGREPHVK